MTPDQTPAKPNTIEHSELVDFIILATASIDPLIKRRAEELLATLDGKDETDH